ncbi:MAG: UDP-2,3-diacylglucosamine diphosphatase [Gammaproteobacteria bacterium]|jgi:UDP-2,3-diacylglucosamine hydrolase|nr:UDP-2,3-diacylglucosamine diphosphatase [Gammaproteobacteria bacterium]|tara:strand:- start:246 stop:965 length:720 start_codon:yes stop_codon:yes gene_type:complete
MSYLFISDLHLDANSEGITQGFKSFLRQQVSLSEKLFILGDLFEVWLGDDDITPFNSELIQVLSEIKIPKYIMHGNRDFLLGQAFCDQSGLELLPDPTVIEYAGEPILLMHGDSLCTRDEEYIRARNRLRQPVVQEELLAKPLNERAAIARDARNQSKEHTHDTAADIMDVTSDEVTRVMAENDVHLLIHGHTHRPGVHDLLIEGSHARRIVLGDWGESGWYLKLDGKSQDLVSFEIGS